MTESASIPIGLGMLGIGSVLVASGFTGNSLSEILQGNFVGKGGTASASTGTTDTSTTTAPGSTSQVQTALAEMDRMIGVRSPYKWGGGHAGYTPSGPWDCSGAVSQALHVAGLLPGSPRDSVGLMVWGKPGKGKYLTVYANPTHTFIICEAGSRAGQAWGTTNSTPGGGVAWHHHSTAGFIARHYPGT